MHAIRQDFAFGKNQFITPLQQSKGPFFYKKLPFISSTDFYIFLIYMKTPFYSKLIVAFLTLRDYKYKNIPNRVKKSL